MGYIITIFLFVGFIAYVIMPGGATPEQIMMFYGKNFAHRGLHKKDKSVPENSLAAFEAAVEAGYAIELDVTLSKDKNVVVFHDATLDRVCGVEGNINDKNYDELSQLRLHETDERIPLLQEVFDLVDKRVTILVEIKSGPQNELLCILVAALIKEYGGPVMVQSFNPGIVAWFKQHARSIMRGQLSAPEKDFKSLGFFNAFMLGNLLTMGVNRAQFISYRAKKKSFLAAIISKLSGNNLVWTIDDSMDYTEWQNKSDALIFEHCDAPVQFKTYDYTPSEAKKKRLEAEAQQKATFDE